ncbi:hypothetical protein MMC08_008742 [Hypocenomyce scalaris]|nr:hypothetical protein [Hypocenomyce scalaris]
MATLAPSTANTKPDPKHLQRPPPPSLFLGPPSRNTSNISLSSLHPITTHTSTLSTSSPAAQPRAPLLRNRSARGHDALANANITSPLGRSTQQQRQQQQQQSEGDRTDALWAEMQATLAEVELSAVSGTHVFGAEHSKALEELRTAQIALAQAWARSEADEVVDHPTEVDVVSFKSKGLLGDDTGEWPGDKERKGSKLEEETEGDILLARKRREANDRYFRRVNGGMLDVVGRLEEVAAAMEKVERESREIWNESDSMDTGSGTS